MKSIKLLGLGIGFMALSFVAAPQAKAFDIGVGVGEHRDHGHYEDRTETVEVAPAGEERRVIPAQYETITHRSGRTEQRLVAPERVEVVPVPARFETRTNRVWVEDRDRGPKVGVGIHF